LTRSAAAAAELYLHPNASAFVVSSSESAGSRTRSAFRIRARPRHSWRKCQTSLPNSYQMSIIPALLAALAVVVAALIGLAGVYVGWLLRRKDQIRQEEREDAYRWHRDQLNGYADYLGAVFKNYFRWTGFTSARDFEQHVETVRERGEQWMESKALVDILSSLEVLEAADELADALADVVDRVATFQGRPRLRWRHSFEDSDLEEYRQKFITARKNYLRAVRDELGLSDMRTIGPARATEG